MVCVNNTPDPSQAKEFIYLFLRQTLVEALNRIRDVLTRPTYFFTHLKERGIITAFMYLSFLAFFTSFLKEIASYWGSSATQRLASILFGRALEEYQLILGPFLSNVLISYLIILLTSFLWAGILPVRPDR